MNQKEFIHKILPYKDKIYRYALRLLHNRTYAEDAVQEVTLKLWNYRMKVDDYANEESLIMTITRNYCLDELKKSKRLDMNADAADVEIKDEVSTDVSFDRQEQYNYVLKIINRLPVNLKEVIHLRDVEGLTNEEISKITGQTVNNVRVTLSRARQKVRNELVKIYGNG